MENILKKSMSQYVKKRFKELLGEKVNAEKAYTIAVGEYVDAAMKQSKKK